MLSITPCIPSLPGTTWVGHVPTWGRVNVAGVSFWRLLFLFFFHFISFIFFFYSLPLFLITGYRGGNCRFQLSASKHGWETLNTALGAQHRGLVPPRGPRGAQRGRSRRGASRGSACFLGKILSFSGLRRRREAATSWREEQLKPSGLTSGWGCAEGGSNCAGRLPACGDKAPA